MKKIILFFCCISLALMPLALVGCGNQDDTKTKIYVELKSGGTGVQWLYDAGERFSALHADTEYESGKKGVSILPRPVDNVSLDNAETSGTAIYDLMNKTIIENDARAGKVLCIDDVLMDDSDMRNGVKISALDKISESQRSRYMYNGHYYGGPSCEFYPVISYDRNLFDRYQLYFASADAIKDESNEGVLEEFDSVILNQTYYFLPNNKANNDSMKSCGPDGEYNTDDDGLPSSLYELIALCEYMKGKDINPFNFTGGYKYYSNFLLSALYTSLQGYDDAAANYNFNGQTEIVIGFEDDYLFPGVDDGGRPVSNIKKPITKIVDLTEENGYYTTWEVNKYYAEAFMDLCVKQGWFGPSATNNDDQKAAMSKFVFSDNNGAPKIAMHLDGSYWYNEATEGENYFKLLEDANYLINGMREERDVRVMPLPVNYSETVQEGEGKPQTLLEMNYGMFVINKNVENTPGLMQACKDFLKFLYTDAELSAYTAGTSILRSMDYTLSSQDASKISSYGKYLVKMINEKDNKILYFAGDNDTFKYNTASFAQTWTNAVFSVGNVSGNFYEAIAIIRKSGYTTVDEIFSKQAFTKATWTSMYRGNKSVTDVDGLVSLV